MNSPEVRLAILEDHELFRNGLIEFLSKDQRLRVVIEASKSAELFQKLKSFEIDIIIMDVFMPDSNSIEVLKLIRKEYADIKVIILSISTDLYLVNELIEIGVHGYISKAEEPYEIQRAIRHASEGRIYQNKILTDALYSNLHSLKSRKIDLSMTFSKREQQILQLLWEEKSNKEIADICYLGTRSIEKIRQFMKAKTGCKSTIGLMKYAIAHKILNTKIEARNFV